MQVFAQPQNDVGQPADFRGGSALRSDHRNVHGIPGILNRKGSNKVLKYTLYRYVEGKERDFGGLVGS